MNEKQLSEFGKGFISCLVNFAGHFMFDRYGYETKNQRAASLKIWGTEEQLISSRIRLWANGATDHLYEIIAPDGIQWDNIRELVTKLRDKGLRMGHCDDGTIWTNKDKEELLDLVRQISRETDVILGVESDNGQWS